MIVVYDAHMKLNIFNSKNKDASPDSKENVVEIKHNIGTKVLAGSELIKAEKQCLYLVKQTQNNVSCTKEIWVQYYLPIITRAAELIQLLPASEKYHHDHLGGLLIHTLEVMRNATQISTSYILPPDTEPEDIVTHSQRWRAGILVTALLHDMGKLLADVEVMITKDGQKWERLYPLFDAWPVGSHYRFRYAPKKKGHSKSLHERTSLLAFNKIVNRKMFAWFCEDPMLMQQMFDTLTYSADSKNLVAEIIIKADKASVKNAIGDRGQIVTNDMNKAKDQASYSVPDQAFAIIRNLVAEGDIKINKPGAMMWRTTKYSFFVSKPLMDLTLNKLRDFDLANIPREGDKLQMLLANEGFIQKSILNQSHFVWLMKIRDLVNDWESDLTMLVIDNEQLGVGDEIPLFDGELIVLDRAKKKAPTEVVFTAQGDNFGQYGFDIEEKSIPKSEKNKLEITENQQSNTVKSKDNTEKNHPSNVDNSVRSSPQFNDETPLIDEEEIPRQSAIQANYELQIEDSSSQNIVFNDVSEPNEKQLSLIDQAQTDKIQARGISNAELRKMHKMPIEKRLEVLEQNDFFSWITKSIANKKLKVNQPNSSVHVTEKHVLLVTPSIFKRYLKANLVREKRYAAHNNNAPFTAIQHEFDSIGLHKTASGSNHTKVKVEGDNRKAQLTVYVLPRDYFPCCDGFMPNEFIKL